MVRKMNGATANTNNAYNEGLAVTDKQKKIISLAATGMHNSAIAANLKIREQTVKNHFSAIMKKLSARDRTHAVILALHYGLIEWDEIRRLALPGTAGKEYNFESAQIVDDAPTPNRVSVIVSPGTGEATSLAGSYQEIARFDPPKISQGEAQAIASGAFKKRSGRRISVSEPVLEVTLYPVWKQHLAWKVEVSEETIPGDGTNSAICWVDAHTGRFCKQLPSDDGGDGASPRRMPVHEG